MTSFVNWTSPEVLRALAWTLLHFVWQGAALAALLAVALAVCRSAQARYAAAVATLGWMLAVPGITFMWLLRPANAAAPRTTVISSAWRATGLHLKSGSENGIAGDVDPGATQPETLLWLVEAWFLGVVLLSLRTAGGLLVIARMRHKESRPVTAEVQEKCLVLQRRMGLKRVIRFCECHRLDAPAVLGWFRPVVLLPVRALTGLSAGQIEVLIAHELAHIRRFDSFVNFFQIVVETLLFYHPAVWWVSRRIRIERENCCDDEALAVCGDAVDYARALTLMEEWRAAPSLMMAANHGPLAERVLRLLGMNGGAGRIRVAGLGISVLCLAGALVAGNAFLGVARGSLNKNAFATFEQGGDNVIVIKPAPAPPSKATEQAAKPSGPNAQSAPKPQTPAGKETGEQKPDAEANKKESYLDGMEAVGFKNLTVDELIGLKTQGVTPAYVREIRQLGLQPTVDELIGMKVQGITPEYIRQMRTIESNLSVDELIGMKVQGVTPEYANELRELAFQPRGDELIGLKVQGVTPEYIRGIRATGLAPDLDELIGMKVQGVTEDYVKALQAAGFKNLSCDEVIGAKVQGVTPEFIEKARKHGFQNLTLDKLIALKHAGIL